MIYCSLGETCHAATILKMNGLKHASFPFDWIFSSAEMVKHCIQDDFKTFLSKSEYTTNLLDPATCEHEFYSNVIQHHQHVPGKEKVVFNHHNPLEKEEDYQYFTRCVDRFKELLASPEEKTFVIFQKGEDVTNGILKSFELIKLLNDYTTNFTLLVIHYSVQGQQYHQLIKGKNLKFLNIRLTSKSSGVGFENKEDDHYLNKLFNEIR